VPALDHHMPERHRVPGEKAIAPIVECRAELAAARYCFELARRGPETKITAAKTVCARQGRPGHRPVGANLNLDRVHLAVAASVRAIDPVVEAPGQPIHA